MATRQQISGQKIRTARLAAGLSQGQLARATNTSERNIVRWENDHNAPRMEHVAAIAKATGRDLAFFLGSDDDDDEESRTVPGSLLETLWAELGHALGRVPA